MRKCELCKLPARLYCESDQASLCARCDHIVHAANFLVARHTRTLLCSICQTSTPWNASGARLGNTVTECDRCLEARKRKRGGGGRFDDAVRDYYEEEEGENQLVPWSSSSPPTAISLNDDESSSSSSVCASSVLSAKRMRECDASDCRPQVRKRLRIGNNG